VVHPVGSVSEFTITDWPLIHAPWRCVLLALAIAAITMLAVGGSGSWVMGLFAWLALISSTWRQWVPVRLVIDHRGIRQHAFSGSRLTEWTSIGRIQWRHEGVTFYPLGRSAPLANFRAFFIPWDDRRDTLGAILRYHALRRGIEIIDPPAEISSVKRAT